MTELLPCPFCQGAVQFRKALHVSDGNVDSVIHAAPSSCPMVVFEDGSVDESILAKWNTRAVPAQEPVAWRYRWHAPDDALWEIVPDKAMLPTDPIGWEIEPLYAAPVPPADLFAECAEIALEHAGAFNTTWTEESRMAYNQACRDIARAITLRASNRKTMDAIADRELRTASLSLD